MEKFIGAIIVAGIPLLVAAAMPVGGMYLAASVLALLSFGVFVVATGGIHEIAAAVLLVGAFLCVGLANLARILADVQTVAAHFSRRLPPSETMNTHLGSGRSSGTED